MGRLTLGCEVKREDSDSLWAVPDGEQKKEDDPDSGSDELMALKTEGWWWASASEWCGCWGWWEDNMWTQKETPSSWWGTILAAPPRRRPGYGFCILFILMKITFYCDPLMCASPKTFWTWQRKRLIVNGSIVMTQGQSGPEKGLNVISPMIKLLVLC